MRLFIAIDWGSSDVGESNIWDWSGCEYILKVFIAEVVKEVWGKKEYRSIGIYYMEDLIFGKSFAKNLKFYYVYLW